MIELPTFLYTTQRLAAASRPRPRQRAPSHRLEQRRSSEQESARLTTGSHRPRPFREIRHAEKIFIQRPDQTSRTCPRHRTLLPLLYGADAGKNLPAPTWVAVPDPDSTRTTHPGSPATTGPPFYNCSHYCELNSGPCAIKRKAPMCQAPALIGCKHRTISIVYVSKD